MMIIPFLLLSSYHLIKYLPNVCHAVCPVHTAHTGLLADMNTCHMSWLLIGQSILNTRISLVNQKAGDLNARIICTVQSSQ